jgi:hypothetical protein
MSNGLQFDEATSRKVEALYLTPDVVAQRCQVLKALELKQGERVFDIGSGPGLLAYDVAASVGPYGRAPRSIDLGSEQRLVEPRVAPVIVSGSLAHVDLGLSVGISGEAYFVVREFRLSDETLQASTSRVVIDIVSRWASQMRAVLSDDVVTMSDPSGLKAAE